MTASCPVPPFPLSSPLARTNSEKEAEQPANDHDGGLSGSQIWLCFANKQWHVQEQLIGHGDMRHMHFDEQAVEEYEVLHWS